MYSPKFQISHQILKNIGLIEAAREIIISAPIIPAWEKQFQEDAVVRTVHYGTHLEGNDLNLDQTRRVLEGEQVVARGRDVQEVINYRAVLNHIERLGERIGQPPKEHDLPFEYRESMLKKIHALTIDQILESGGDYRSQQVVVRSVETGEISWRPPPAVEVPYLVEDLIFWLNQKHSRQIHPVLRAGITHLALVAIHPFVEGNGRTARAMATLVLFTEGYDIRKLFSLEEHFDRDIRAYYHAIEQAVSTKNLNDMDLTSWLEYFTRALAVELNQVREKIKNLSMDEKLRTKVGKQIALTKRQIKLVEYMKDHEYLLMRDAQELIPMVSDDTLLRDLKDLMAKGLVKKLGSTKGARYLLV
jgi:Fic family protein